MKKVHVKHFQYTGVDDYEKALDVQINEYIDEKGLTEEQVVDVKFSSHGSDGSNAYTALLIYKK